MAGEHTGTHDSLEREIEEWVEAIPGAVDVAVEVVRQRIGRSGRQFERVLAEVAEEHAMSTGDWEALSVLARSSDGEATPGEMGRLLGLTSGTVSVRIERLVASGLVERVPHADRRQRPVRLTERGRQAWGEATLTRTRAESDLVRACLTESEVAELGRLLGVLLAHLELTYGPAPRHDMTRGRSSR